MGRATASQRLFRRRSPDALAGAILLLGALALCLAGWHAASSVGLSPTGRQLLGEEVSGKLPKQFTPTEKVRLQVSSLRNALWPGAASTDLPKPGGSWLLCRTCSAPHVPLAPASTTVRLLVGWQQLLGAGSCLLL